MQTHDKMKFSVLMPVYYKENASFLDGALESITTKQELMPNEIIIVEDGPIGRELMSTLDKYTDLYPAIINRIKLKENVGMGRAMNIGLTNATNEYIARMDSDDLARPDRFKEQINFLKANKEVDIVGSLIEEFKLTPGDFKNLRTLPEKHEDILNYLKFRCPFNHMTVIFKKHVAIKAGGYWSRRNYEDYNLWYEMAKSGARLHNIQKILVDARVGNNMVGRRRGLKYFKDEFIFFRKMKKEKFITPFEFLCDVGTRGILRVIPQKPLEWVYYKYLRS